MSTPLSLEVCLSSMQMLASGAACGPLQSLGLLPNELELVTGQNPWRTDQRNQVSKILHTLMYSTLDALGLHRFAVPAEYVAATIAMFVKPRNSLVACSWMEADLLTASAIGNPNVDSVNRNEIKAEQLHAIILQIRQQNAIVSSCRAQFEARVGMAIDKPKLETLKNAAIQEKGKQKKDT